MNQFPHPYTPPPKESGVSYRAKKLLAFLSPFHNRNRFVGLLTCCFVILSISGVAYATSHFAGIAVIPKSIGQSSSTSAGIEDAKRSQTSNDTSPGSTTSDRGGNSEQITDPNKSTDSQDDSSTPASPPAPNTLNQPTEGNTENPLTPIPAKRIMNTTGALLSWNFDSTPSGSFTADRANQTLNNANGHMTTYSVSAPDSLYVEKSSNDGYLVKKMPKGSFNARSGSPLRHSMAIDWRLNTPLKSGYFAYNFKTSPNFDSVKGGKLPGLCGGTCPSGGEQTTDAPRLADGGNNPAGKAIGWSGRNMWQAGGHLIQYFYHPNQTTKFGPGYSYRYASGSRTYINDNKWHSIEHYVKMNTPGKADGVFQAWFDGTRVMNLQNIRFRDDTGYAIDMLMFSVFFGGGDASFATTKDEYLYFDDFVLSKAPITH